MFDKSLKRDENGQAEMVMAHGPSCATMRILEGSTVLINLNEVKPRSSIPCISFSDASSPSSHSEPSSEGSREQGTTSSQGGWSASGSTSSSGNGTGSSNEQNPDFRMLSFSGMHYAPDPAAIQQTPAFVAAPMVYAPLDTTVEEHAGSKTGQAVSLEPVAHQSNLQTAQNGTVYPFPAAGFASAEQPTMQDAALPAYPAPVVQYDPMTGVMDLNVLNPNGYVTQGVEMYDQASWERFLSEMGMPHGGAGV